MANALQDICETAGLDVQRELSTLPGSKSRMADLSVSGSGLHGDTLIIDVTISGQLSDPFSKSTADARKARHYEEEIKALPRSSHFYPFSMTSTGGRSRKAKQLLQKIAPVLAHRQSISLAEAYQWCYRRINVALASHVVDNLVSSIGSCSSVAGY